jgi:zinc transport system substrate-binding protein
MIYSLRNVLPVCAAVLVFHAVAAAAAPNVVASVRPLHGLVAAVMDGVGTPTLLLDGAESPHSYALTPSDANALAEADVVVWVGEPLETFLERPLAALSSSATVLTLAEHPAISFRENRDGGVWDVADQDQDHGHDHGHDHGQSHTHGHDHADHDHGVDDGHVWLDPKNAAAVVEAVRDILSELDPANAAAYDSNAEAALERLTRLEEDISAQLAEVADQPFLTAHDSLQYFDRYFGLNAAGAIAVTPDQAPGARRLAQIEQRVRDLGAVCLLSEPGFQPSVMRVIQDAAQTRVGQVDPLGLLVEPGADLYFELMTNLAKDLAQCLSREGS